MSLYRADGNAVRLDIGRSTLTMATADSAHTAERIAVAMEHFGCLHDGDKAVLIAAGGRLLLQDIAEALRRRLAEARRELSDGAELRAAELRLTEKLRDEMGLPAFALPARAAE